MTCASSPPSAAAKRRPVSSGSTGSESAHSMSLGRASARSASRVRWPASAPGMSGLVGRMSGKARAPALAAALGNGRS